jgi:hypothetical protein
VFAERNRLLGGMWRGLAASARKVLFFPLFFLLLCNSLPACLFMHTGRQVFEVQAANDVSRFAAEQLAFHGSVSCSTTDR